MTTFPKFRKYPSRQGIHFPGVFVSVCLLVIEAENVLQKVSVLLTQTFGEFHEKTHSSAWVAESPIVCGSLKLGTKVFTVDYLRPTLDAKCDYALSLAEQFSAQQRFVRQCSLF